MGSRQYRKGAQAHLPPLRRKGRGGSARNKDRAEKVIRFIENLIVPSGEGQGEPFRLQPWQKEFIRDLYEPHGKDGKRIVRRAILSVGRKNGKSALIAALVLVHLIGPEAIVHGEIYSAANDRDQASIIFKVAKQIVEADNELRGLITIVPSTKTMVGRRTGSVFRAVSSESGGKHGLNPSFVIYDELAQAKNRDLYDVLDTSMGARAEPLFAVISTQSNDPEHILSQLIDDGLSGVDPTIVCHLYAVPDEVDDIYNENVWRLANPALGTFRSLKDLQAIADKAQRLPAEETKFRNLYLNQRVSPTASLIPAKLWKDCVGDAAIKDGEQVYLGLDLSSTNDLTALMMGSASDDVTRVVPYFWKPVELLKEHSDRDFGAGNNRYVLWRDQGQLLTTPGRAIHPQTIAMHIAELCERYQVLGLAFDRWRMDDLLRELDRVGLATYKDGEKGSGLKIVPWGQGFTGMAPAVDALERAVIEKSIVHPNNQVLNWNMVNAVATMDPAGNRKIDKSKIRFRIDGAVALAMMCGLKSRDRKAVPVDVSTLIF